MCVDEPKPANRQPDSAPTPLERAALLLKEDRPDGAASVLRNAIKNSSHDWRLHDALGNALLIANRDEEAIGAFMTAVQLNPTLGSACFKIGRFYISRGLIEPAVNWLRRAMEVDDWRETETDGEAIEAVTLVAAAEAQFGNRTQAAALLDSWVAADPDNPIRRHLAMAVLGETVPAKASPAYVSRLFNDYADSFDESLARLRYCGPDLVAKALQDCPSRPWLGGDALDVGCGTGLVGEVLRPIVRRLVGVDLSENMLQHAADRGVYDELCLGEMNSFMFSRPYQFDVVTASDVLTYVGDLGEFCSAAQAVLRPGGWIVAVLESIKEGSRSLGYRFQANGRFSHSGEYLRKCLGCCGFTVQHASHTPMRTEQGRPAPSLTIAAVKANPG